MIMENFWIFWGPIILGTIIGIIIFKSTNNYNQIVINQFKEKTKNISNYKTYNDVISLINKPQEISYENEFKICSWIIRSENRELYKITLKFDKNDNNLGVIYESNQI